MTSNEKKLIEETIFFQTWWDDRKKDIAKIEQKKEELLRDITICSRAVIDERKGFRDPLAALAERKHK